MRKKNITTTLNDWLNNDFSILKMNYMRDGVNFYADQYEKILEQDKYGAIHSFHLKIDEQFGDANKSKFHPTK